MSKVYIAGAISSDPDYKAKFDLAEKFLIEKGHAVIKPYKNLGFEYKEYIDMGLCELMKCDTIYLLEGWEHSQGAKLELQYAKTVGLTVMFSITSRKTARHLMYSNAKAIVIGIDWNLPKYNDNDYGDYDEYENECLDIGHEKTAEVVCLLKKFLENKKTVFQIDNTDELLEECSWDAISEYIVNQIDERPTKN